MAEDARLGLLAGLVMLELKGIDAGLRLEVRGPHTAIHRLDEPTRLEGPGPAIQGIAVWRRDSPSRV